MIFFIIYNRKGGVFIFAKDRIGDKNWDTYEDIVTIGKCGCGKGTIEDVYFVASHEKVLKIERDFIRKQLNCSNPMCPSRK